MPGCMVIGCLSMSGREKIKYGSSPLPKSLEIRTKWLEIIDRPDYQFVHQARVCHKHFRKDDFLSNSENIDSRGREKKRKTLKPTAIPSLYLSNDMVSESELQMVDY